MNWVDFVVAVFFSTPNLAAPSPTLSFMQFRRNPRSNYFFSFVGVTYSASLEIDEHKALSNSVLHRAQTGFADLLHYARTGPLFDWEDLPKEVQELL